MTVGEGPVLRCLGVDPGLRGGIALFEGTEKDCGVLWTRPMPTRRVPRKNRSHKQQLDVDGVGVAEVLRPFPPGTLVVIEKVHGINNRQGRKGPGRKRQSVASAFSFGRGVGKVLGVCEALRLKVVEVTPQTWKGRTFMHLGHDFVEKHGLGDKALSVKRCQELWPHLDLRRTPRCTTLSHDLAEAALLAAYGKFLLLYGGDLL